MPGAIPSTVVIRSLLPLAASLSLCAQTAQQVLVVGDSKDSVSRQIVDYSKWRGAMPAAIPSQW
jgi:hypothetical protein